MIVFLRSYGATLALRTALTLLQRAIMALRARKLSLVSSLLTVFEKDFFLCLIVICLFVFFFVLVMFFCFVVVFSDSVDECIARWSNIVVVCRFNDRWLRCCTRVVASTGGRALG